MAYLIDTDLWIAIERRHITVADIYAITKQAPVYVSPINLPEIRLGIELMTEVRERYMGSGDFA